MVAAVRTSGVPFINSMTGAALTSSFSLACKGRPAAAAGTAAVAADADADFDAPDLATAGIDAASFSTNLARRGTLAPSMRSTIAPWLNKSTVGTATIPCFCDSSTLLSASTYPKKGPRKDEVISGLA